MNRKATPEEARRLTMQIVADAIQPSVARAFWGEFGLTLGLLLGAWTLAARVCFPLAQERGGWWIPVYLVACLFLTVWVMRLFVIQHDAGHGGLSPSKKVNYFIGHVCSVFEFTPFLHWHRHHSHHHRTTGHIEQQDGLGDVYTLTTAQYLALSRGWRLAYRILRSRFHLFVVVPSAMFFIVHRLPMVNFPLSPVVQKPNRTDWVSVLGLDLVYAGLGWWAWTHWSVAQPWVISYLIAFVVTATIGIVMFFTQHQFESTYYAHDEEWSFYESAMKGSMTLRLPFVWMEWCLGYINYHSIHHLQPTIPMYNLRRCYVLLKQAGVRMPECRVSDMGPTFKLTLWDEEQQRMISFAELEAR